VLLGFSQDLGVLECLGRVLVQLRKRLTFKMPSPTASSIADSAALNQNLASLPPMFSRSGGTPNSGQRLRIGVAL
jgi:hypothetical protein